MMYWTYGHRFVMGANYHTGALVVNVPWDSIPATPDYAPDDAIYLTFGVDYARRNPMIWGGGFPNGVTRGWEWYIIRGGMQDWAYHWWGEHHVTIEDSSQQPPPYSQMDTYWAAEREAMLWWMRRPLTGLRGLVTDANSGAPLDAWVLAEQIGKEVYTDPDVGDYHRMLLAGTYTVTAGAYCYLPQTTTVTLPTSSTVVVHNFALLPAASWTVQGTVTAGDTGLPLLATVEFLGSPLLTQTNPANGHYAAQLCAGTYTMRVSSSGYRTEERQIVVVDGDQVQDFALQPAPCTLLVDDDEGENYQGYYAGALDALGLDYDVWAVDTLGSPNADVLSGYGRVIWLTGDDSSTTLTSSDQAALASFLDGGGRLFVSGQDIGYDIGSSAFYSDCLHADYLYDDINDYTLAGLDYLAGVDLTIQGGDGANNQGYPSQIDPIGGAVAVLDYGGPKYGGVAYQDSTYAVVYFSFGYEAINNQPDRTEVMSRTLAWLGGCEPEDYAVGLGDSQAWGQPGQTVTHTFALTNLGTLTDSYTITLTPGNWPATLLDGQVGPLGPGQSSPVYVSVDIPLQPLSVSVPLSDVLILQADSVHDPGASAQARGSTFTTVTLDLALDLSAAASEQVGLAGQSVSYTLLLSNSGGYSDSYRLSLEGNAWPSQVSPTHTSFLGPGEAVPILVRVDLPGGPGSARDDLTVRARSGWDDQLDAEVHLHTLRYEGGILANSSQVWGQPGETVTHTFGISNGSSLTDTYVLALIPGIWPATLLDDTIGPLLPGQAGQARVRVDIPQLPLSPSLLLSDVLTLQVSSTLLPGVSTSAAGTAFAGAELGLELTTEQGGRLALSGQVVTYALVVSNSGGYSDSYSLSLGASAWPAAVQPTRTVVLGPGEAAMLEVWVTIPAGPAGETNTVVVRATSSWDAQIYAEQALVTTRGWGCYLPLLLKGSQEP